MSCAGQFGFRSAGQLAVWQFLLFVIDIGMLNPSTRDTVVRSVSGHRPNVTKRLGVLTIVVVRLAVEREGELCEGGGRDTLETRQPAAGVGTGSS